MEMHLRSVLLTMRRKLMGDFLPAVTVQAVLAIPTLAADEQVWIRQLGTPLGESACCVAVDDAGNAYVTGTRATEHREGDVWAAKLFPDGAIAWTRRFGTTLADWATGIAVGSTGVYLTARTYGSLGGGPPEQTGWMAKFDTTGRQLWRKQLAVQDSYSVGVAVVRGAGNIDEDIYLAGSEAGDIWLAKYHSGGRLIWTRRFGTSQADHAYGLAADNAGNLYVVGNTVGPLSIGDSDVFMAKYSQAGNQLWLRQIGTEYWDSGRGIAIDASGNIYLTGYANYDHYSNNWLAKLDATGRNLWSQSVGTRHSLSGLAIDAFGYVYLAGSSRGAGTGGPYPGDYDAWLQRYDPSGYVMWTQWLATRSADFAGAPAISPAGSLYLAGGTLGSLGGRNRGSADAWIVKYSPGPD